jgi:hypothetical protein
LKYSTSLRNARLDLVESHISTTPKLRVYSGTAPTNPVDAATGTLLADVILPSDWLAAAASGTKAKSGTWADSSADGTGTAGYFRIWDSAGTTCHIQGTVTITGGGGDMTFDSLSFTAGQSFTVTAFTLTAGNG